MSYPVFNIGANYSKSNQKAYNLLFFVLVELHCQRDCRRFKSDHSLHFFASNH